VLQQVMMTAHIHRHKRLLIGDNNNIRENSGGKESYAKLRPAFDHVQTDYRQQHAINRWCISHYFNELKVVLKPWVIKTIGYQSYTFTVSMYGKTC
jgi:hypothetical protein